MSYANPTTVGYRFPAAVLTTAAIVGRIQAPDGKKGRVVDVSFVATVTTNVICTVDVGTSGAVAAYATETIPITTAGNGAQGNVSVYNHEIPEDTLVEVSTNGEPTAGTGDLTVIIDWY